MDHISANLAFGGREKNIWGYKKLQGGKKPIRKTGKKVATFFCFLFFWRQLKICGREKISRWAPNGNVTPLHGWLQLMNIQYTIYVHNMYNIHEINFLFVLKLLTSARLREPSTIKLLTTNLETYSTSYPNCCKILRCVTYIQYTIHIYI